MTDNRFAPPQADVATADAPAVPPRRTLWAFGAVLALVFGYGAFTMYRYGVEPLLVLFPLVVGLAFFCAPFVVAAFVWLVVTATRRGSGPHAFWGTVKVLCWVVGVALALTGVVEVGGQVYGALLRR